MLRRILFPLAAVLLGLAATVLVVESALWITSALIKRDDRDGVGDRPEGEVRVSCIGESTTYGRWPAQLEELLNRERNGPRIRVINRGNVGILTDIVAERTDGWLDEDQPQLVITMLGINDEGNVLVYPRGSSKPWLREHLRSAHLLGLLWRSTFDAGLPKKSNGAPPMANAHIDSEAQSELDQHFARRPEATRAFSYSEMIAIQRELILVDPGTPFYHVGYLKDLVLHHETGERLGEFFTDQAGVDPSALDEKDRLREIASWAQRTGDRFAQLRLATSVARLADDPETERQLLSEAIGDPELTGLAWLRRVNFASWFEGPEVVRQCLLKAAEALPDDYQWALLLGDVCFRFDEYGLAAEHFERAKWLRPDLPASHELVVLGWLARAYEQSGDSARAAETRALHDEFELGRFREFTRHHYRRVVDKVRAREIPVIAMQYPLLSVESLRRLLDDRDDVTYLENRTNFETALSNGNYRGLFHDSFAGSFGHLTDRGNMVVAENVARAVSEMISELEQRAANPEDPAAESP